MPASVLDVRIVARSRSFFSRRGSFETFLNDINSPWVGLHMDVGNIHDTGFPEQWIEIHGPRITRVHVKDVLRHRGRCGKTERLYEPVFRRQ